MTDVAARFRPDLEGVHHRQHRAAADGDILHGPAGEARVLQHNAVIRAADEAVLHQRVAGGPQVDAVGVGHMPVVVDDHVSHGHMVAAIHVQRPAHGGLQDDVPEHHLPALLHPHHGRGPAQVGLALAVLVLAVADAIPVEGADGARHGVDLLHLIPPGQHGHREGRERRLLPGLVYIPLADAADSAAARHPHVLRMVDQQQRPLDGLALAVIGVAVIVGQQLVNIAAGHQCAPMGNEQRAVRGQAHRPRHIAAALHQDHAAPGFPAGPAARRDGLRVQPVRLGLRAPVADVKHPPLRQGLTGMDVLLPGDVRVVVPGINVPKLRIRGFIQHVVHSSHGIAPAEKGQGATPLARVQGRR